MQNGGNTRGDAKFDIDGAIATLAHYAELGAQLGSLRALRDGEEVQLGRTARYRRQHLLVPRDGVAVHINAFNFPAWGIAEKAACALLAGMPVDHQARHQHGAGRVEAGRDSSIRSSCRGARSSSSAARRATCSTSWRPQDVVAFTGSCDTAARLREQLARSRRTPERRGRLAQRGGAGPRRRARHVHLGPVPHGRGARHDAEDRPEVHRHAAHLRPARSAPGGAARR